MFENHFDLDDEAESEALQLIPLEDITFPKMLDNTILSTFSKCPRQAYYAHFQHLAPKKTSIHLHAGKSFAVGMETYRKEYFKTQSVETAQAKGLLALTQSYGFSPDRDEDPEWIASAKSYEGLACAYIHTTNNWPADADRLKPYVLEGEPAVEMSFALPLPLNHPDTGEPIIFHGRFDMLGTFGGAVFVEDDKTTSQLGAQWSSQWDLRSQFTGYCVGAETFGVPVAGAIVRGTAILKTKITHAESITYRPKHLTEEWKKSTIALISQMFRAYKTKEFPTLGTFNESCNAYGGCSFKTLCLTDRPENWLDSYRRRVWNPANPEEGDE